MAAVVALIYFGSREHGKGVVRSVEEGRQAFRV
jgi:hypothetical protein